MTKITALVLAAGRGQRFSKKTPKQYHNLNGQPIIYWTLKTLEDMDEINHIVVVIHPEDICHNFWIEGQDFKKLKILDQGGSKQVFHTRRVGINYIRDNLETDWLLITDAVRPMVKKEDYRALFQTNCHLTTFKLPINFDPVLIDSNGDLINVLRRSEIFETHNPLLVKWTLVDQLDDSDWELDEQLDGSWLRNANMLKIPIKLIETDRKNLTKITYFNDLISQEMVVN